MRRIVTNSHAVLAQDNSVTPYNRVRHHGKAERKGKWYADNEDATLLAQQLQVNIVLVNANPEDITLDNSIVVPLSRAGTELWPTIVVATNCSPQTNDHSTARISDHYELVLCNEQAKRALLRHVCWNTMGYDIGPD